MRKNLKRAVSANKAVSRKQGRPTSSKPKAIKANNRRLAFRSLVNDTERALEVKNTNYVSADFVVRTVLKLLAQHKSEEATGLIKKYE